MPVAVDATNNIVRFISKKEYQTLMEKQLYDEEKHRLHWLNILIGDIKNNITGICHGITKRDLPLF